jgi:hypothetical protein
LPASSLKAVVATQLVAAAGLAAMFLLARVSHVPFSQISRDPATALHGAFITGYLSYMGACLWCAAAAIALFCGAVLRRGRQPAASFFIATGLISTMMLVDDLFMMHDGLIPYAVGADIEKTILGAYGVIGVAWLVRFRA